MSSNMAQLRTMIDLTAQLEVSAAIQCQNSGISFTKRNLNTAVVSVCFSAPRGMVVGSENGADIPSRLWKLFIGNDEQIL